MQLNAIIDRLRPGEATRSHEDRSPRQGYPLVVKFVAFEVGLFAVAFVFDALGALASSQSDALSVTAGLLGAFAVILAVFGAMVAVVWAVLDIVGRVRDRRDSD